MSALLPLYKALTVLFRADATLMALLPGGVWNGSVRDGQPRPYLIMGTPTESEINGLGEWGKDGTIEFDTYSDPTVRSPEQVDTVLDRVEMLLRTPLAIDGHTDARLRLDFRTVQVEEDETRHGTARYRFFTLETA